MRLYWSEQVPEVTREWAAKEIKANPHRLEEVLDVVFVVHEDRISGRSVDQLDEECDQLRAELGRARG